MADNVGNVLGVMQYIDYTEAPKTVGTFENLQSIRVSHRKVFQTKVVGLGTRCIYRQG